MPVSSLIFVVILAVWAVYLVQHWVRRRDHLATARSVDRFSEAMRVLERRRALPRPDVSEQAPAAPSVILRPARPEVVVKRGTAAEPAPARPARSRTRVSTGATPALPPAGLRRAQAGARVRAAGLLAASLILVTLVALVIADVLPWWWSFVGLAALALTVAGIRSSVARDRTARAPRRRPVARAVAVDPQLVAGADPAPGIPSSSPLAAQARAVAGSRPARRAVDLTPQPLYDIEAVEASLSAAAQEAPVDLSGVTAQEPTDSTWSPVPVPPPTYTLKARAGRGGTMPGTGSSALPQDGTEMALDEEFEDLPTVDRVG